MTKFVLFSAIALILGSQCVRAANVYIQKGEGGAGLDAYFPLDKAEQLSLSVTDCRRTESKFDFGVGLFVSEAKRVSNELEKLRHHELNETTDLFLCVNEICEERTWEFLASGFGDAFFTHLSINQKHDPIRALRVIIPNERRRYEYRGDVDSILTRICR